MIGYPILFCGFSFFTRFFFSFLVQPNVQRPLSLWTRFVTRFCSFWTLLSWVRWIQKFSKCTGTTHTLVSDLASPIPPATTRKKRKVEKKKRNWQHFYFDLSVVQRRFLPCFFSGAQAFATFWHRFCQRYAKWSCEIWCVGWTASFRNPHTTTTHPFFGLNFPYSDYDFLCSKISAGVGGGHSFIHLLEIYTWATTVFYHIPLCSGKG